MLKLQDPMNRQNGWYVIQRRLNGGVFGTQEIAFWERKFDNTYGQWSYRNGVVRDVSERLDDDLVLRGENDQN